jgi:hypothetical protein
MRPELIEIYRKPSLFTELEEPTYQMPRPAKTNEKLGKRMQLFKKQAGKCLGCDLPFSERRIPTLDHIVPKKKGGTNKISNLILLCQLCNSLKGHTSSFDEASVECATAIDETLRTQMQAMQKLVLFKRLRDNNVIS